MSKDVTIKGITYTNVQAINYETIDGIMYPLNTLTLNDNVIWNSFNIPKDSLENMSWADISAVCKAGLASEYWSIGDQKTITVNGTSYVIDLIGFDHDDVTNPTEYGREKAGATFQLHDLEDSTFDRSNSWQESDNRNLYLYNDYNQLESDLKSVIVSVEKFSLTRNNENSITSDNLFLLSENEVYGEVTYALAAEGTQYEYYKNGGSKIKISSAYGRAFNWSLRSVSSKSEWAICSTNDNGSAGWIQGYGYLSFAFCV